MHSQRLGCLSPMALITALIAVVLLVGAEVRLGNAIFSPGELSAASGEMLGGFSSHAEMTGDCAQCHAAPWSGDTLGGRCMACHTNIQAENADSTTLHGGLLVQNIAYVCQDCHTEHHGPDGELTVLDPLTFPHTAAGFDMTAHAMLRMDTPFACADCHTTSLFTFDPKVCVECHHTLDADFTTRHVLTFWTDCQACHDGVDRFTDFDHNRTNFALLGAHQALDCAACHVQAHNMEDLQATAVTCESCHLKDDAHQGEFGVKCGVCHGPEGWKPAAFNHDLADFKLVGEHTAVECAECHTNGYKGTPQDCAACHTQDDIHAGSLGTDCAGCHAPQGWKPAHFDHNLAAFKLDGKHAAVECAVCHTPGPDGATRYKGIPQDCQSCHLPEDAHDGRFGLDCETCHTPEGWKPAGFEHDRAAFKLQGAHTQVKCAACHTQDAAGTLVYAGTPTDCAACHRMDDAHSGKFGMDCARCHTVQAWKPAHFDHSQTSFRLQGAHIQATCTGCHVNGQFKGTPTECVACHRTDDAHKGQFGLDCARCHTVQAWKPANFDHSQTGFRLQGAHIQATCTQCHVNGQFKGTPTECVACHRTDDAHSGQFGVDCARCHTVQAWKPANFDHSQTSFRLQGKHAKVTCTGCHVNGQFDGTPTDCAACHRTDDAHNGQFGTDCGSCHNPSDWGDATFDHSRTAFALQGRHAQVTCTQCHTNGQFKGTPQNCAACHSADDAHNGQFGTDCGSCHNPSNWGDATFDHSQTSFALQGRHAQVTCTQCHTNGQFDGTPTECVACHRTDDAHNGQFGLECATCHNPSSWGDATFNHSQTGFPLQGQHAQVECQACHASGYAGTPQNCAACHQGDDAHGGSFGSDCGTCHNPSSWGDATFDHSRSSFPLTGAHTGVACANCHTNGQYSSTPSDCAACHSEPAYHAGMFGGQACSACHSTSAWRPADYNGPHTFPMGHGDANSCNDCHQPNLTQWSCYNCHDQGEMADKHKEIGDYSNCLRCHADGRKHDD